jgi:hypothetical protein
VSTHVADDPEQQARLLGLMAVLALPPLTTSDGDTRRVLVEVEVAPGRWHAVDSCVIESDRLVLSHGVNGHRVEWAFSRAEPVPRWRMPRESARVVVTP